MDYKSKEVEEKELELFNLDYYAMLHSILRRWWMILAVAISFAMLAYMVSDFTYTPQYTTKTTMIVTAKGTAANTYASTSASETTAELFTSVLTSDVLKKMVAQSMGETSLHAVVEANQVNETSLIELKVTADDPVYAYETLLRLKQYYPEISQYILEDAVLEDVLTPSIPMYPTQKFEGKDLAKKAFVVGAMLVVAFIVFMVYMRDDIKGEQDAKTKLEVPLLGMIYHEQKYRTIAVTVKSIIKKTKKSILISNPTVSFGFVEDLKKICAQIEYEAGQNQSKVIMVTSMAENEGKSTTIANLALSLAQKGKKVALVDGDLRQPAQHLIFDIPKEKANGINALIDGKSVEACLYHYKKGKVDMLLGNRFYEHSADIIGKKEVKEAIYKLRQEMDYVLIDTPPISVISDAELWAEVSDASILVMKTSVALAADINEVTEVLSSMRAKTMGCILNDVRTLNRSVAYGGYYGYSKYGKNKYYGKYGYYSQYASVEDTQEEQ